MFATSHQVPDQIPDRNKKSRSHYETGFRILTPFILPGLKGNGLKLFNHIKHFRYLAVNVVGQRDFIFCLRQMAERSKPARSK